MLSGTARRFSFKNNRRKQSQFLILMASLSASPSLGTTYYVSPSGSDSNSGTSSTTPWGSVAKVDSTVFQPGDRILFQYGSTWGASLTPTSSGTVTAPIVYGAYGNSSLGNPTFSGSDPINASAFTSVTGTTYAATSSAAVNWVYDNHQFTHEAQDALTQAGSSTPTDPTTDLNYVETTPGSFYFNASSNMLYVNTGKALSGNEITAATRQDAIYVNTQSNLVIQNLNTTETAADNAGYGLRTGNSSNIYLINSTSSLAGKHNVGIINTTGFVGTNLTATGSAPDQGFGGASAFVAYSDANPSRANNQNNTSVWTNITYTNANGAYPAFISHGDPGAISSVILNNVVSLNGYGTGIDIQPTGPNEVASVQGGQLNGGSINLDTNNSIVNGVSVSGADGSIVLSGTHDVAQNNTMILNQPYLYAGRNGAIVDQGTNNTIRFNVIDLGSIGPGIGLENKSGATSIYGNIIRFENAQNPTVGIAQFYTGPGTFNSDYNVFTNNSLFFLLPNYTYLSTQQWQSLGYDVHSLTSDPMYVDRANGNYTLASNSPALGLYPSPLDPSLATANSMVGAPYTDGNYNAGLNPNVSQSLSNLSTGVVLNNGQTATITPASNALSIQNTGAMIVLTGSTLVQTANVTDAGTFIVWGNLFQTGNFTNTGAAIFAGSQIWSPRSIYTNAAGPTTFQTDVGGPIAPAGYLSVVATGGVVNFTSTQHLLGLNISAGALVQVTSTTRSVLVTPSLSVAGTLDLAGNDLQIQGGNLQAITVLIARGYNGGLWTGTGITSSTAANDTTRLTAIGDMLNGTNFGSTAPLGLFDGSDPDVNDVLVRYTYYGDANLDGKVDATDYSRIDNGFITHLTGWYNGDFNYDGIVNGSDYTLMDNAFNRQGAQLASSIASISAQVTTEIAAVPEPTALGLVTVTAPLFLRRRCRVQLSNASVQETP